MLFTSQDFGKPQKSLLMYATDDMGGSRGYAREVARHLLAPPHLVDISNLFVPSVKDLLAVAEAFFEGYNEAVVPRIINHRDVASCSFQQRCAAFSHAMFDNSVSRKYLGVNFETRDQGLLASQGRFVSGALKRIFSEMEKNKTAVAIFPPGFVFLAAWKVFPALEIQNRQLKTFEGFTFTLWSDGVIRLGQKLLCGNAPQLCPKHRGAGT